MKRYQTATKEKVLRSYLVDMFNENFLEYYVYSCRACVLTYACCNSNKHNEPCMRRWVYLHLYEYNDSSNVEKIYL